MSETIAIQQVISKVVQKENLNRDQARQVMRQIMEGSATSAQIASLLTALRMKGETIEEITGFAETMREMSNHVQTEQNNLLDTCGTGGDGSNTFNISTASALVAAAGGVRVAKHGNRGASSKSGSADVLEALGVNIALDHVQAGQCLQKTGICFMFAPVYHQSMKHASIPRKEIGIRTVFNMLGPLTNPAGADRQLLGVFDRSLTVTIANVLKDLKLKRALVVSSYDGLDEVSISAPTQVAELKDGEINTYDLTPDLLGLKQYKLSEVTGGDAEQNAEIIRNIFRGEPGANRDIVLANAGASFYVSGLSSTIQEGIKLAAHSIDSGAAMLKLEQLIQCTGELRHVSG